MKQMLLLKIALPLCHVHFGVERGLKGAAGASSGHQGCVGTVGVKIGTS